MTQMDRNVWTQFGSNKCSFNKKVCLFMLLLAFLMIFSMAKSVVPHRAYLIIVLLFFGFLMVLNWKVRPNALIIPLFLLYLTSCISNWLAGLEFISNIATSAEVGLLWFCISGCCDGEVDFRRFVKTLFLPVFIGGPLIGFIQLKIGRFFYPTVGDSSFTSSIMLNANQTNSNYSALTMMTSFFLSMFLMTEKETMKRNYGLLAFLSAIAIVLTLSRGAIAAVMITLLLAFFFRRRKKKKKLLYRNKDFWGFFVVLILLCVFSVPIFNRLMAYLQSKELQVLLKYKKSSTLSLRTAQWKAAVWSIIDGNFLQKIFGYGSNYYIKLGEYTSSYMSAHNVFFGQLGENGIVGAICIIWIYVNTLIKVVRLYKLEGEFSWICCWTIGIMIAYMLVSIIGWEFWLAILLFDQYYYIRVQVLYSQNLRCFNEQRTI